MLSRSGIHAIRALMALSELEEGRYAGSTAIAGRVEAPPNYLGKLLQTLAREGLVVSQKGRGGGWALGRSAADISLYDIVACVDDLERWKGCFLTRSECSDENPCHVHEGWAAVRDAALGFLEGTSLARLQAAGGMPRLQLLLGES